MKKFVNLKDLNSKNLYIGCYVKSISFYQNNYSILELIEKNNELYFFDYTNNKELSIDFLGVENIILFDEIFNKDIKTKLKLLLLSIPYRNKSQRETITLAKILNQDKEKIQELLSFLTSVKILEEKIQYQCFNCKETINLSKQDIEEYYEDEIIECDNCEHEIDINLPISQTGYRYYNVINEEKLNDW